MQLAQVLTVGFVLTIMIVAMRTYWDACARPLLKDWARRNNYCLLNARQQWFSLLASLVNRCLIKYDVALRREDGSLIVGTAVVDVSLVGIRQPVTLEPRARLGFWFGW